MNEIARIPSEGPQLRTLLLTDLVDSTGLVERLGDIPAADLFREHDRLVLKLQQEWHGRLIDRSDGLLLLFERPIDGLGFALDYARGLRDIGAARNLPLQARAGLHVGEVLTWKNSEEAVQFGAKPLEVEGLAKPMAARLMTLARPGQVLLSAVAESLTRRAARELGERGENLLWKSYGRWRFKGVPEAQEIHEVGEVGIAPLRAPPSIPKAWRDIPLWRRPAALVAEVVLITCLGVGAWFVTKPQPAIAFAERDWVVVGDLRNLTGEKVLDDSLAQAFRIGLEQSRYVNVLSDMKARDTLARMQRKPGTLMDRAVASEIAVREAVPAVILPTVSEVGGKVRVSAEVVDPHTQTTVYAESADGSGAGSTLGSIDKVTAALRGKLGEAMASIEKDSEPLPQVTTSNLDALRAYALGQNTFAKGRYAEAANLYQRAIQIDPDFALAYLGIVRASMASVNVNAAMPYLKKAITLRSRLPAREALYLDAWAAEFEPGNTAPEKWKLLAQIYPEYFAGSANYAGAMLQQGRYAEAGRYAKVASAPQNQLRSAGLDYWGRAALGQENYGEAQKHFEQALELGLVSSARRLADVHAVRSDFTQARKHLEIAGISPSVQYIERISFEIDQGDFSQASKVAEKAYADESAGIDLTRRVFGVARAVVSVLDGRRKDADAHLSEAIKSSLAAISNPEIGNRVDDTYIALSIAYVAQRIGDYALAAKILEKLGSHPHVFADPKVRDLAEIVRAGMERSSGDYDAAIVRLRGLLDGDELFQVHAALQNTYHAAGRFEEALEQARWMANHRGKAYIEINGAQAMQALNVADTRLAHLLAAEALLELRLPKEAQLEAIAFLEAWPAASLPAYLRLRVEAILPASKQ
ncbi:MAG: putative peptide modification system cyclase [Pseudoxanthomonas sp.]